MDHARPRSRINGLDSMRGICALCVVVFHLSTTGMMTNFGFFRHSWLFVDFFFVLSGFVITAAYSEDIARGYPIRYFAFLRLARIWPLHMVMLLCFLALELSRYVVNFGPPTPPFSPPRQFDAFFVNMALLQVFGIYDTMTWNIPSWSIAAEFWVYLLAALVFRFVRARRWLVLGIVAVVCAGTMASWGPPFLNLAANGSVIRCLYGFCIGSLCLMIIQSLPQGALPKRGLTDTIFSIVEVAVIAAVVVAVARASGGGITVAIPMLFGLCVIVLAMEAGRVSWLLNRAFPVWLGSISYSIYMTHTFVMGRVFDALMVAERFTGVPFVTRAVIDGAITRTLVGPEWRVDLVVVIILVVVTAVAAMTYHVVEQPCNRWARSFLSRRDALIRQRMATSLA